MTMSNVGKIISQMLPRRERLPAPTNVSGRIIPVDQGPIMMPSMNVLDNPRLKFYLDLDNPMSPAHVRAEALAQFDKAIIAINEYIASQMRFTGIRFYSEERAGRVVAVIRDTNTGEVLKVMPSRAALEVAVRLKQASGILVNTTL
jgi:uncharacterized FlaG/YvyC family protein